MGQPGGHDVLVCDGTHDIGEVTGIGQFLDVVAPLTVGSPVILRGLEPIGRDRVVEGGEVLGAQFSVIPVARWIRLPWAPRCRRP